MTMGISLRALLIAGLFGQVSLSLHAQATDLIISEYVEGSGNNKYIELYNGTSSNINLGLYQLRLYTNGSTTATVGTPAMTGTLAPGATIVYRNTSATIYTGAATINSAVNFNGDDAIGLYRISGTVLVDLVGNIGCDPGTAWASGSHSTADRTLVRKFNICSGITVDPAHTGNTVAGCPFPTLESEWDVNGVDVVSNLGSHYMDCNPVVNFTSSGTVADEAVVGVTITLNFSTPAPSGTLTIGVSNGAGAVYVSDYTTSPAVSAGAITVNVPANSNSVSFNVLVTDDGTLEANEVITFVISNATSGIVLGTQLTYDLTIVDNDGPPTVTFLTTNISQLESSGGPHTFTLSISPAPSSSGTITIQVTNGPGASYGITPNDYLTNPNVAGGNIYISFVAGATSASFTTTIIPNGTAESTETVTFTIISATGGVSVGSPNLATLVIGDDDGPPTVLSVGDLAIVGVNANNFACSGETGEDWVSFFSFKPIDYNTTIILTDNGYERCNTGQWGNTEGTVLMRRTGMSIPAGQVITFRIKNNPGSGNVVAAAPDAQWTCTPLNGASATLNLSSNGDQLFFMQGGTWTTNTPGWHNATYTGTVLYGFTTNPTIPWSATCGTNASQQSNLPPGMNCFSMAPTGASDFNKYTGPLTAASQRDWLIRLDSPTNWSSYANCNAYFAGTPIWLTAPVLPITNAPYVPGLWRGTTSTDWFDCKNWDDVTVPTAATNVRIDETASNNCVVGLSAGATAVCASLVQTNSGTPRNLTVQNGSSLAVGGPITVQRTSPGTQIALTVLGNSTLTATNFTVQGTAANEA
ncbi:MAG TPA: lamin tail domain-containing protein, partial [Flavobacteriales bacterium]|nr:lamin tail domain-containing protein [Flavobacteriales bacterium]